MFLLFLIILNTLILEHGNCLNVRKSKIFFLNKINIHLKIYI